MLSRFAGIVRENFILPKMSRCVANFFGDYGVRALRLWKVGYGLCEGRAFIVYLAIGAKLITLYGQKNLAVGIGLRGVVT